MNENVKGTLTITANAAFKYNYHYENWILYSIPCILPNLLNHNTNIANLSEFTV